MVPSNRSQPVPDTRLAYSIAEAAAVSGIGRTLLYAEIAAGRLLAVKAGRRTLIPRDALNRFSSLTIGDHGNDQLRSCGWRRAIE
jgi:excisionase family DNA binding protein